MMDYLHQIVENPMASLAVVVNLIIIESLLSVDNAAVLATMVMDLPEKQRKRALKYGIIGAYFFRGVCLVFASILIQIWWLKPLGGLYLLYLVWDWWKGKKTKTKQDDLLDKKSNWFYRNTVHRIGPFWSTVILVELMDLAFSIDNVFAAVAFTENLLLIWTGVFIGILAMRYVAQGFVRLMEQFPFLETSAFLVILVLGLKLTVSVVEHYRPDLPFNQFMVSHTADHLTTAITVTIFFVPVLTSLMFGVPKVRRKHGHGH